MQDQLFTFIRQKHKRHSGQKAVLILVLQPVPATTTTNTDHQTLILSEYQNSLITENSEISSQIIPSYEENTSDNRGYIRTRSSPADLDDTRERDLQSQHTIINVAVWEPIFIYYTIIHCVKQKFEFYCWLLDNFQINTYTTLGICP